MGCVPSFHVETLPTLKSLPCVSVSVSVSASVALREYRIRVLVVVKFRYVVSFHVLRVSAFAKLLHSIFS